MVIITKMVSKIHIKMEYQFNNKIENDIII